MLGPNADLQSPEEREGGRVLNGAENETLESMLWDAADKVKRQCQNSQRGYSARRDKRGDYRTDRGSLTEWIVDSLYSRPNQKHHGKKRARTFDNETRFLLSVAPSVEFVSMTTAGPSHPFVEAEDAGMYGEEDGIYDEEEEEVPVDQEMEGEKEVEGAPVEGKGKAVDRVQTLLPATQ